MNKKIMIAISLLIFLSITLVYIIINGGYFSRPTEPARLYVDPYMNMAEVGQSFTVNVNISGVVDLYGWEFKLRWNSTHLDVVKVTEGPFLKKGGNTLFTHTINNSEGNVLLDCTLLGNVSGVKGNGTLATIEFLVKAGGECSLDLYDTILVSSVEQSISHDVTDGYFKAVT